MGLFANPLGHTGYPPRVTGTPETQPAAIRAATQTEVNDGTIDYAYVSPLTLSAFSTLANFASPPPLGDSVPNEVFSTTLSSNDDTVLASGAGASLDLGNTTGTIGFFGVTAVTRPGSTAEMKAALAGLGLLTDGGATPLNLDGGALTAGSATVTATSVSGASPVVNNGKSGQGSFTDVIANGAYGTLTITNSTVTAASLIVAVASCTTANSAVQIADIVPGSGTVAFRVFNAGAASTAANININYWVMN